MTHSNGMTTALLTGLAGTLLLAVTFRDAVAATLLGSNAAADEQAGDAVVLIAGGALLTTLLLSLVTYPFVRASIGRAVRRALGTE